MRSSLFDYLISKAETTLVALPTPPPPIDTTPECDRDFEFSKISLEFPILIFIPKENSACAANWLEQASSTSNSYGAPDDEAGGLWSWNPDFACLFRFHTAIEMALISEFKRKFGSKVSFLSTPSWFKDVPDFILGILWLKSNKTNPYRFVMDYDNYSKMVALRDDFIDFAKLMSRYPHFSYDGGGVMISFHSYADQTAFLMRYRNDIEFI